MKPKKSIFEEVPETKQGLMDYVYFMERAIKPVRIQYNRMEDLLLKAKERLKKFV